MTSIDVGDNLEHRCDYPNSIAAATHIAGPHTHSGALTCPEIDQAVAASASNN